MGMDSFIYIRTKCEDGGYLIPNDINGRMIAKKLLESDPDLFIFNDV